MEDNMNTSNEPEKFHLGICMAGAVSAGAYTAGVMDYLLEALEAYEKVRGKPGMPKHKVEIPVMGGASAGGMTAMVTGAALQQEMLPIDKPGDDLLEEHTDHILYHSWVDLTNRDVFSEMLETDDIKGSVASALNCVFIDKIAQRVLKPEKPETIIWKSLPSFFPRKVKLFTTLSNLGGFTYNVNFNAQGSRRPYYMQVHQDYACFELTDDELTEDKTPGWMPLNFKTGTNTQVAVEAAVATGAFPIGFKARTVTRPKDVVNNNPLFDKQTLEAIQISSDPYQSLNIDGGMINNDPFEKVREILNEACGQSDPELHDNFNTFKSTVLMIAPFPGSKPVDIKLIDRLMHVIGLTLSAMLSQMRAKAAQVVDAMNLNCAGQYLIDPSREFRKADGTKIHVQGERAIACGALGGFSGFLSKEFRVHDYFLGRYNCKIFLRDYFTIPDSAKNENPIFKAGYASIDSDQYRSQVDNSWQIIPIVGEVDYTFPQLVFSSGTNWPVQNWVAISKFNSTMKKRVQALIMNLVKYKPVHRFFLWIGTRILLRGMITKAVFQTIKDELNRWHLLK
ncbi:patatin-like phospholipase family protein [Pedobacter sp. PAMC26386]|nr:patatin-like phospholipase family protein [Pedobacter sp. PAMC26386]